MLVSSRIDNSQCCRSALGVVADVEVEVDDDEEEEEEEAIRAAKTGKLTFQLSLSS